MVLVVSVYPKSLLGVECVEDIFEYCDRRIGKNLKGHLVQWFPNVLYSAGGPRHLHIRGQTVNFENSS